MGCTFVGDDDEFFLLGDDVSPFGFLNGLSDPVT